MDWVLYDRDFRDERPKMLLHKLEWDEEVSDELCNVWQVNLKELEEIGEIEVPRRFDDGDEKDPVVSRELHRFSDASKKGDVARVYVRSLLESGNGQVRLLTSKSHIAPLNEIIIPGLDLLGNLLVVKTGIEKEIKFVKVIYWTNSDISLEWIKAT